MGVRDPSTFVYVLGRHRPNGRSRLRLLYHRASQLNWRFGT